MYEIKDISYSYTEEENKESLSHLNLTIPSGQAVLICGESGGGKTSLLRIFNGLIPHFYEGRLSGQVLLDGRNIEEIDMMEMAAMVGTVFQNPKTQFFTLDSSSEIVFGCENLGIPKEIIRERLHQVVNELNVNTLLNKSLFALSGGEKQKVACACVSAMLPQILVLDEPSSNLDAVSMNDLKRTMHLWKKKGKTIIVAEHRLYYLMDLVDRVICMKNGEIACDFLVEDFRNLDADKIKELGLRALTLPSWKKEAVESLESCKIKFQDFTFAYSKKEKPQLHISNLALPQNEIIGIIGNNGAGKSTFAQCICGLKKKAVGKIEYNGKLYKAKDLKKMGYMVFQDVNHQLFAETVMDEVLLGWSKKERKVAANMERVDKVLNSLNLIAKKERHPMSLSGGEKQRVAIVSALVVERDIIIFDEPTSGLDYKNMINVARNISYLKEQGKTVFVITHDPELILSCCTYVVYMENGKVKWQSEMSDECVNIIEDLFYYTLDSLG